MAVRTISTRLAIEGEAEYKASITRINSELKSLQSALKLTESEFKGQANSIDALKSKGEALNRLHEQQTKKVTELQKALENAQKAVTTYAQKKEQLTKRIADNEKALEELKQATGDTTEEQAKLTAENEKLNAELVQNDKYLDAAERGVNDWETKLNSAQIELNDLNGEIKENDKYLDEAKNSTDGCATSIDRFGDKVNKSAESATDLKNALVAAGLIAALKATAEALEACVKESVEYESAMAGVAKTTDLSSDELDAMGDAIQELATKIPATADEIANVTEAAGQLGIAKEDLLAFSEVMVNLGVATNLSSTEAASALAKFANVVGMSADNYENLGSVIVALGNNFATTEADIVSMATRLASTGSLIGLSEAEIMAVATALSSLGIEAEAGGSAISKLLKKFETMVATGSPALADFAAIAGMSAQEFSDAWGENAVAALGMFVDGLGRLDAAGGSSVAVLEDLDITEVRMSNTVLALASSEGILSDAVDMANKSWDENTALAKEAETRYATTESKLKLLSNAFDNVKIAVGDQLTPAIGALADAGSDLLNWVAGLIEQNEWLVPVIMGVVTALAVFAAGATVAAIAASSLGAAIKAMTLAAATNPILLAVTAIAALAVAIGVAAANAADATNEYDTLTEASRKQYDQLQELNAEYERACETYGETSQEAALLAWEVENATAAYEAGKQTVAEYVEESQALNESLQKTLDTNRENHEEINRGETLTLALIGRLRELASQNNLSVESQEEMKAIVAELNEQLPDLNLNYEDVASGVGDFTEALEASIRAQAAQERYADAQQGMVDAYNAQYEAGEKLKELREQEEAATQRVTDANAAYMERLNLLTMYDTSGMAGLGMIFSQEAEDCETAEEALAAYQAEIATWEETLATASADYETYKQSMVDFVEQTNASTDAQAAAAAAQAEIIQSLNEVATAYKEAYDAARESIEGQIGLFDTYSASISEDTDTVEEMLERWAEQTANLASYTENLKLAAEYGLDQGLILSLSDGSTESAGYLATIIGEIENLGATTEGMSTDAQTFVDNFNAAFAETQEAKDTWAETVAAIQTDLDDAIAAMETAASEADFTGFTTALESAFANVGVDFESIGQDAGSGLAAGINGSAGDAATAAGDMADDAVDATRDAFDSHSDSRVMIGIGEDVVGGLVTGVEQSKGDLISTIQDLGDEVVRISEDSARDLVDRYIQEFSQITSRNQSELENLKSTITNTMSSIPWEMSSIGSQMVDGMISGLNSRSGALYSTVRSIVNSAISAARSAAATASPSKKTTKIFEDVGEGMVVGLENKRRKVTDTAQGVVDEALTLDTDKMNSAFSNTIRDMANSALVFDVSRMDEVIRSINDYVPDLSAPDRPPADAIEKTVINFGDINVDVTVPDVDEEQAASVGVTIGEEINRQLRYRGVM